MSQGSSDILILPPTTESACEARRFVLRHLAAWGCDELTDAAVLHVSELVTNAVIHTRTPLSLTLRWSSPRLRVELHDENPSAAIGPGRWPRSPGNSAARSMATSERRHPPPADGAS